MVVSSSTKTEVNRLENEPSICSNCGQEVPELYCTKCGQSIKEIRVSFHSLVRDSITELFNYDSKFFRSVIPLFFKPGFLTHAYLDGKRVRYVSPLRLYILSSVLFFLTLAVVSGQTGSARSEDTVRQSVSSSSNHEAEEDPQTPKAEISPPVSNTNSRRARFTEARLADNTWFGRIINERLDAQDRKIQEMGYDAFMQELVKSFLASLPKALFLLMPFFALLLKFCYWRSDPLYIDHLVFAFHYHAFVYVLASSLLILGSLADGLLAFSILFGLFSYPTYLLLAMKRVYQQNWIWTLLKFFVTSLIYFSCLAIFLLFFFVFSAFFLV